MPVQDGDVGAASRLAHGEGSLSSTHCIGGWNTGSTRWRRQKFLTLIRGMKVMDTSFRLFLNVCDERVGLPQLVKAQFLGPYRLGFCKTRHFRNWICFCLQAWGKLI
jgi:hypothetical protein